MTVLVGDYDQATLRLEIDEVFVELVDLMMDLDDDPIRFGPKRLIGKVAKCKRLVSRCTEIEINLSTIAAKLLRKQRVADAELELLMQDLLASDPEVRAGRSVRDREAIANTKLKDERALARLISECVEELKGAITVVKTKKIDLKDTQGRLKDQARLVQEEIALGNTWGTAPPPGLKVSLPSEPEAYSKDGKNAVEVLIDDIDSVVGEVTENEPEEPSNGKTAKKAPEEPSPKDEAQDVLDALLSEIPEEPSPEEAQSVDAGGISKEALSGSDLEALIDGDWS